jgi:hypothetical protein
MEEADYLRLTRRMKNLVGPYAKGFVAGLDRAFLNQREFKEKHPELQQHKYCMRKRDSWGEGYKHGFEGLEPAPPRGAPKSDQPIKTHTIRLRVTKTQFSSYNERGGNEWFLSMLEPHESSEDCDETVKKPVSKRKRAKSDDRNQEEPVQSDLELVAKDAAMNRTSELNAA